MIDSLRLANFKCFENVTVKFGNLTVLAGLNGAGKSSLIQALLVVRQIGMWKDPDHPVGRGLQGALADVGLFRDVLFEDADEDVVQVKLSLRNSGSVDSKYDDYVDIKIVDGSTNVRLDSRVEDDIREDEARLKRGMEKFQMRSLYRPSMYYLCAERLGPRKALPLSLGGEDVRGTPMGKRGKLVLAFLIEHGGDLVATELRYPGASDETVAGQTNAWLDVVSPGAELTITTMPAADLAIASYSFRKKEDARTKQFQPANVGFGLSYTLPVIVALLAGRDDDLIIIENPEAHLRPAGQTMIAELAARAAKDGRQVILETHSDHVLDGIRVAVAEGVIHPDQVAIHYFERDYTDVRIVTPTVGPDGRLDVWPEGFFDELERNLARLGPGRSAGSSK